MQPGTTKMACLSSNLLNEANTKVESDVTSSSTEKGVFTFPVKDDYDFSKAIATIKITSDNVDKVVDELNAKTIGISRVELVVKNEKGEPLAKYPVSPIDTVRF